jgi:nitroimidazol reductase NimA-like FMN-containing flavoprotein (pyridoxamine 5'-phosphate oxidase superfamily)
MPRRSYADYYGTDREETIFWDHWLEKKEVTMTSVQNSIEPSEGPVHPMTQPEIDQFLTCAPVGRIGLLLDEGPYIVPVGHGYAEGKIFFHTCEEGIKMEAIRSNPNVCFEVDESLSDASLAKSVIIMGRAEIIDDKKRMIPYLQKLIDKYRVPVSLGEYMSRGDRKLKEELEMVRICLITPYKVTGRKIIRTNSNF